MKPVRTTRVIAASLKRVFEVVADVRNFRRAVPHITNIEFLTEQQVGAGTRFRETRVMNGHEHTTELHVAEFVENDRVRMIADAGGTIWDTLFTVRDSDECVLLEMNMDIQPHTIMARITTPLIRSMVVKGVEADMDAVKAFCESEVDNRREQIEE